MKGIVVDKLARHKKIREIVRTRSIGSQAQLLRVLRKERLAINQSTLSRDLVELDIRKIEGRYEATTTRVEGAAQFDLSPVVRSWRTCGPHLIAVRTSIGQAQAVGVAIDSADDTAIAATLAGDDTLFIATVGRRQQSVALRRLATWFGDKHER